MTKDRSFRSTSASCGNLRTATDRLRKTRAATCGRRVNAFTLLELIISIGLFVVLLGMLWNIISLFSRTQTVGTRLAEKSQLVRSLAQLFEEDLRAAIQDPIHPHKEQRGDDDVRRFGLSGSAQSLRIDVIEINPFAPVSEEPQQRMGMFGDFQAATPKAAELKTVFYEFRVGVGLSRREIDFETPNMNAPGPEGSDMSAPEVVDCRFRYYNGSSWSDSWESLDRNGLPVAIEATLQLLPLAEAAKFHRVHLSGQSQHIVAQSNLSTPITSRIVAYLPTSPVRKFEAYQRATPKKKEDPNPFDLPPEPKLPEPQAVPEPEPQAPPPPGSQQIWIRGK